MDLFSCQDKHVVAGLLKKFFRDLPQPLFTFEFRDCFLALYQSKRTTGDLLMTHYRIV